MFDKDCGLFTIVPPPPILECPCVLIWTQYSQIVGSGEQVPYLGLHDHPIATPWIFFMGFYQVISLWNARINSWRSLATHSGCLWECKEHAWNFRTGTAVHAKTNVRLYHSTRRSFSALVVKKQVIDFFYLFYFFLFAPTPTPPPPFPLFNIFMES